MSDGDLMALADLALAEVDEVNDLDVVLTHVASRLREHTRAAPEIIQSVDGHRRVFLPGVTKPGPRPLPSPTLFE